MSERHKEVSENSWLLPQLNGWYATPTPVLCPKVPGGVSDKGGCVTKLEHAAACKFYPKEGAVSSVTHHGHVQSSPVACVAPGQAVGSWDRLALKGGGDLAFGEEETWNSTRAQVVVLPLDGHQARAERVLLVVQGEGAQVGQQVAGGRVQVLATHVRCHRGTLFQEPAHYCLVSILDVVVGGRFNKDLAHIQVAGEAETSLQVAVAVGNKVEVADQGKS